jgi:hypothetical protein
MDPWPDARTRDRRAVRVGRADGSGPGRLERARGVGGAGHAAGSAAVVRTLRMARAPRPLAARHP